MLAAGVRGGGCDQPRRQHRDSQTRSDELQRGKLHARRREESRRTVQRPQRGQLDDPEGPVRPDRHHHDRSSLLPDPSRAVRPAVRHELRGVRLHAKLQISQLLHIHTYISIYTSTKYTICLLLIFNTSLCSFQCEKAFRHELERSQYEDVLTLTLKSYCCFFGTLWISGYKTTEGCSCIPYIIRLNKRKYRLVEVTPNLIHKLTNLTLPLVSADECLC